MMVASIIIGISSLIFSLTGLYLTAINILYNLYAHARSKIEENCKHVAGISEYKDIPTEEQVKLLEKRLLEWKNNSEQLIQTYIRLIPYIEINLNRYKMLTDILNWLTFGRFKHVV